MSILFFLILSKLVWYEKGIVKEWDVFYLKDTIFILYTLKDNKKNIAKDLFLVKILNNKIIKKENIFRNKKGIFKPRIFDNNFYGFETGEKIGDDFFPVSLYVLLKGKKYKIFEGAKKRPVLGNYHFLKNFNKCIENLGEINILDEKNKIIKSWKGTRPEILKDYVYYIKGEVGSPNSLKRINIKEEKLNEENIFNEEIVLLLKSQHDSLLFFLTDPDEDLFPENIYIIFNTEKIVRIWSDTLHIIFPPSAWIKNDTVFILCSFSQVFVPEYVYLGKFSLKNKNIKWEKIFRNINGMEVRWIKFPYFILLIRKKDISIFKITSL